MRWWRRKRFLAGLLTGTCVSAVLCAAFWLGLLSSMQLQSTDLLFKAADMYGNSKQERRVVIIAIDEKSLNQLGRFPSWPRSYYASVIDALAEAEARTVVLDVLFSEPAIGDEELAKSLNDAGNVILPLTYSSRLDESTGAGEPVGDGSFVRPLSLFEESALDVGHANLLPDGDGVVRRLPVIIRSGDGYEPALALVAVARYLRRPQVIESPIENNRLSLAGRSIPLDNVDGMFINYTVTSTDETHIASFETVSFVDVVKGEIDSSIFKDNIVVIGATASALGDAFWTPTGRMMNGVEIHANAIYTILTGDFLRAAPYGVTIALIMALALLASLVALRLRVLWATLLTFLICAVYFLIAFSFFDKDIMLNMVYPPLAILGAFVGINLLNITFERSEKRAITETFGRYISPPVVDRILTAVAKDELMLEGHRQEVTVAFADVRDFTNMSENMQPEDLVRVLNVYLAVIIEAVLKYDGMVNKFGGDSVMAVWNVPTPCESHALLATKMGIEIQHRVEELQRKDKTLPKVAFGVGIGTGNVVAGNMGSEARLEYSVVGDAVNIAARITGVAEGGKVWISADTFELIKGHVVAVPLEPLVVKGKKGPIKAYEVTGIREEPAGQIALAGEVQ